jgi:hypothetical protein
MKRIFGKSIFYIAVLVALLMGSCYSELSEIKFENLKWSPELGVPLIDSKFTLIELLEANADDIDYSTDSNNTIVISISDDSLFSQSAADYYSLSDQLLDIPPIFLTQTEIDEFNSTGQVSISRDLLVDYPNQGNLDEIVIDQGTVETQVQENFPALVDLSIAMEDPSNISFLDYNNEFNYLAGTDPFSIDQSIDPINNISFKFDGEPRLRQIKLAFQIVLNRVDQDLVFGVNSIDLNIGFQDLEFGGLYGDLNSQDISTEKNTIRTDFLGENDLLDDIEFYFENPQFRMIFTNSMGIPVRFEVNNFVTFKNGEQTEEPINNTIELQKATEGSSTVTETNFDNNFKNIINNIPDSVSLQADGVIDPENTVDNFVDRDSYLTVGYEINLPLEFSLSGLEINETVSLDGIDTQELQYALFKFTSENSLPIDLDFRADLLDEDSVFVMNLFDGKFLAAGTESQPTSISDIIRLEDDSDTNFNELDDLKKVGRIGIKATVSTKDNGSSVVRITSDASVQFNLAVQAKYNVKL